VPNIFELNSGHHQAITREPETCTETTSIKYLRVFNVCSGVVMQYNPTLHTNTV